MPKISVIVPVYKVESYLCKCVDSILSQTFTNFELILVDDGSPDTCPTICDEYAINDKRIHVIHQNNKGLSEARNAGLDYIFSHSNSDWITFIDSDDWVRSNYLEELLKAASTYKTKVSACYLCDSQMKHDQVLSQSNYYLVLFEDIYNAEYFKANPVSSCAKLYRKELFDNVRFPAGKICEDLFTIHKVLFKSNSIAIVDQELYIYFTENMSITRSSWTEKRFDEIEASEELICFMDKHNLLKAKSNAIKRYVYVLHNQLNQIDSEEKKELTKYRKVIQNKLRKILIKYRKIILFQDNKWHWEAAFPRMMNIYWIISNKLKL